jgi:hypothetical protein
MGSTNGKLIFNAVGGPYGGQPLYIDPPVKWESISIVLPAPKDHIGEHKWHQYCFSRLDWCARYEGPVKPRGT